MDALNKVNQVRRNELKLEEAEVEVEVEAEAEAEDKAESTNEELMVKSEDEVVRENYDAETKQLSKKKQKM